MTDFCQNLVLNVRARARRPAKTTIIMAFHRQISQWSEGEREREKFLKNDFLMNNNGRKLVAIKLGLEISSCGACFRSLGGKNYAKKLKAFTKLVEMGSNILQVLKV